MTDWAPRLLEVTSLVLVAWCLADARDRGPRAVLELVAGALFGLAVEQLAIWGGAGSGRPDAYRYARFAWMITPDVPLVVVACWGCLLYGAMKYSDSLGIPLWLRPAADGLYALMLDLTMDVVAVRMGLWTWQVEPGSQWLGVPYSNFGGWLLVGILFSAGVRTVRNLAEHRPLAVQAGLLGLLVAAGAPALLFLLGRLFTGTEQDAWPAGLMAMTAAGLLTWGLAWRRQASPPELRLALADVPPPVRSMEISVGLPLYWHGAYLTVAVLSGVFSHSMFTLFLTGALAALGCLLVVGLLPTPRE